MSFIAFILMSALNPAVDRLEKLKLPRPLAILLAYALILIVVGGMLWVVVPPLAVQTGNLVVSLPEALGKVELFNANQQAITQELLAQIGSLPQYVVRLTVNLFGNIISVLTTFVLSFYLLLERKHLNKYLAILLGKESPEKVARTFNEVEHKLGGWVRGELLLMIVVGVLTYVGLLVLGIDNALPLAIIAAVLEIVPNIGPIISAVPAVLIALAMHPFKALATVALYFLVQLAENNLLVPNIMKRAVGVNPMVSILGLVAGFKIYGPMGAILAIPIIILSMTLAENIKNTWRE